MADCDSGSEESPPKTPPPDPQAGDGEPSTIDIDITEYPLAIVELFGATSHREMLLALETADRPLNKSELARRADVTKESVRRHLDTDDRVRDLVDYGAVVTDNPEAAISTYRLATPEDNTVGEVFATMPVELAEVCACFESVGMKKLVTFFMDHAETEEWYTQYGINQRTGMKYKTLADNLPTLAEAGFLESREGSRSEEYRLTDSPLVETLFVLNDVLVATVS